MVPEPGCQGAGGGGVSQVTEKGQEVAGTKPFLDKLQGQAGSHSEGLVGAHFTEPSTGDQGR